MGEVTRRNSAEEWTADGKSGGWYPPEMDIAGKRPLRAQGRKTKDYFFLTVILVSVRKW